MYIRTQRALVVGVSDCIGAISSLGKSTFVMQIADNMANNDIPVIIFSLEMKAIDLTAKAISRQTYSNMCEKPTPLGVGWIAQNIEIMCM